MRAVAAVAAAVAGVLVPAGAAAPPPVHPVQPIVIQPVGTLVAHAVPKRSGARPAELRLSLRTELQCGRLSGGPIIVGFPSAERMPAALQSGDVLVNGKALQASLAGHVVSIALPKTIGLTCDVIAPATVSVVFTESASLGNPATPGTYHVSMRVRGKAAVATFVVA